MHQRRGHLDLQHWAWGTTGAVYGICAKGTPFAPMKRSLNGAVDWFIACIEGTIVGVVCPCGRELLDERGIIMFFVSALSAPCYTCTLHCHSSSTFTSLLRWFSLLNCSQSASWTDCTFFIFAQFASYPTQAQKLTTTADRSTELRYCTLRRVSKPDRQRLSGRLCCQLRQPKPRCEHRRSTIFKSFPSVYFSHCCIASRSPFATV